MSLTPDMMPAWELREHLKQRDEQIIALRAENERLKLEARAQYADGLHDGRDKAGDEWEKEVSALRAENERLRAALEMFACDCPESDLCKFPHACRNYIARAALEQKP